MAPFHPEKNKYMFCGRNCAPHVLLMYRPSFTIQGWGSSDCVNPELAYGIFEKMGTYLPLSASHGDVHEAAGVCESLLGAALGSLLLLLRLNLYPYSVSGPCPTFIQC
jgi:hypothetical protein